MDLGLVFCLAGVTALLGGYAWWDARRRRRLLARLVRDSFGKPPADGAPRTDTRRYWAWQSALSQPLDVDDRTWEDLAMDEVFARLNSCQSAVGQQYLYAVLHRLAPPQTVARRQALRRALEKDDLCFRLRFRLALLGKRRGGGFSALLAAPPPRPAHPRLYRVCALLPWLTLPGVLLGGAGALLFLAAVSGNVILYYQARQQLDRHLETLGYVSQLLEAARDLAGETQQAAPEFSAQLTAALAPLRAVSGPLSYVLRPLAGDTDTLLECLNMVTLLPILQYLRAADRLEANREAFSRVCALVGEAELALAARSFAAGIPVSCAPEFTGRRTLCCEELVHPLLAETGVGNSADFSRPVLLTGSNASGKSTFLKALAVNAILAQTLGVCTARRFSLFPGPVVTSMAVTDDVTAGESYFVAELKSLRRVLDLADGGARALCFIDEILKGTNTVERVAASAAVLRRLADTDCLCFAATHDGELTRMLAAAYDNRHFEEQVALGGVTFDYRLRPGPASTRNAIALLAQLGFPAAVTGQARRTAAAFDETGVWPLE